MKYWLSHLPLEVWVDCYRYPWITREELGRIVDRFGNRKYAEYLQFYLHDWGKQTLKNRLCFNKGGLCKYVNHAQYRLNFPQAPMPDNIKSFKCISIYHFNVQPINFLHQIGPILSDVKLQFSGISPNNIENLRAIFANLLPLLNGIRSLSCDLYALPTVEQCFGGEEFNKIKVLELNYHRSGAMNEQAQADVLLNWLISPRQDNGPRYCKAFYPVYYSGKSLRQFEFLAPKSTCTFALTIFPLDCQTWRQFVDFHLQNNNGEELHGVKLGGIIRITRHQANCGTELEECIKGENFMEYQSRIRICNPTVGLIDALDAPGNEDDDDKPSTSKKARMA